MVSDKDCTWAGTGSGMVWGKDCSGAWPRALYLLKRARRPREVRRDNGRGVAAMGQCGGGHPRAAGATINLPLEEAMHMVILALEEELKHL